MNLDQVVDPAYMQHDILEKHSNYLEKFMHVQGCYYRLNLMTVMSKVELNREALSLSSRFHETEVQNVVKCGLSLDFPDGCHLWNAVQMMQQEGCHL